MRTVVPFDAREPKSRLADCLSDAERTAFARVMLTDVLATVREAGGDPLVLATAPVDVDAPTAVDERPLSVAVDDRFDDLPVAVVMADLALATPVAVRRLYDAGATADVAIAPGRGGGTNALVVDHPAFHTDYHGCSYRDHRRIAREVGASVAVVDSFRLSTDVDERADLAEVLLHGEGRAADWLRDAGLAVVTDEGRVRVERR